MLTGAYPHTTRVQTLLHPLSDEVSTITETLQADGYQTVAVVTNRMLTLDRRLNRGFDVYDHDATNVRDATATSRMVPHISDRVISPTSGYPATFAVAPPEM